MSEGVLVALISAAVAVGLGVLGFAAQKPRAYLKLEGPISNYLFVLAMAAAAFVAGCYITRMRVRELTSWMYGFSAPIGTGEPGEADNTQYILDTISYSNAGDMLAVGGFGIAALFFLGVIEIGKRVAATVLDDGNADADTARP